MYRHNRSKWLWKNHIAFYYGWCQQGTVWKIYYNNELADRKSVFKKYIAYVPQENPLIDELTTKDNLLLWLGSNRKIKDGFENGVLKDLGIDEFLNKQVNELSGGMKRRLSIGISLSNNAPIMLLDEPGSALDIYGKQEVNSYISNYVKMVEL